MNVLSWITASVKHAVLRGFQEATEELQMPMGDDAPPLLTTSRSAPALAPPLTPPAELPPPPTGNGAANRQRH